MKFGEKIEKLLTEISNDCHKYAMQSNIDFYVFQTPIIYMPKLLIIVINPGGSKSYSQLLAEKGINQRMPQSLFYKENTLIEKPKWESDAKLKGSDTLRERLSRIFNKNNNLDILSDAMMMNMFYFNTEKEVDIANFQDEVKSYCINKTKELIETINPKNILFLTSSDKNLKKCGVVEIEILGSNVKKGKFDNRTIYSIPHYGSYAHYSHENSKKTAKKLSEILT